jgi:hypothetical protein
VILALLSEHTWESIGEVALLAVVLPLILLVIGSFLWCAYKDIFG